MDDALQSKIECPVCTEVLRAPISSCVNGHAICSKCKVNLRLCPLCRSKLVFRNIALEHVLMELDVPCTYRGNGCSYIAKPNDIILHETTCFSRLIRCCLQGCHFKYLPLREFQTHAQTEHADHIIKTESKEAFTSTLAIPSGELYVADVIKTSLQECFLVLYYINTEVDEMLVGVSFIAEEHTPNHIYTVTIDQNRFDKQITYSALCLRNSFDINLVFSQVNVFKPSKIFLKPLKENDLISISVIIEKCADLQFR